jgi:hypothetical protein
VGAAALLLGRGPGCDGLSVWRGKGREVGLAARRGEEEENKHNGLVDLKSKPFVLFGQCVCECRVQVLSLIPHEEIARSK